MEDPIFSWLIPDDAKRRVRLCHYFGIELRYFALPRGRVETTDDLAGAMLSLPPGKWRVPPRTTLLHGRAFGARIAQAASLGTRMELRHMRLAREPHYYVRDIGVHPDTQGRGLGSALMRPTLERCDRERSVRLHRGLQRAQRRSVRAPRLPARRGAARVGQPAAAAHAPSPQPPGEGARVMVGAGFEPA